MDYKILKVRLDLTKDNRLPVKPVQGESAVKIEFTLIHNSQPFPLTGTTVNVKFRKKDGTISLLPGVITNATAGIAEVKLTNQVLLFAGTVAGIVEVLGDAGVAKSFIFTMEVQPGVDDPNTESVDEYNALVDALSNVQSIRNEFDIVIANATVDSEVILARGGKTTLKERLDGSDAQLAEKVPKTDIGLLSGLLTTAKTSLVNAINELFNNKANKAQENWIQATLLNGSTGSLQYRKNEFGRIEIRGRVTCPVINTTVCIIPSAYRTVSTLAMVAATDAAPALFFINGSGEVLLKSTNLHHLSGISYLPFSN